MNEQEAIETAAAAAQQDGYDLADYQAPSAKFSKEEGYRFPNMTSDSVWRVMFQHNSNMPGIWFWVFVDDQTAGTYVRGGY